MLNSTTEMMNERVVVLIPGLTVTIVTFLIGTIANSYIIIKILQKPKCFLNFALELNISFLGLMVCFFIALLSITENILSLTDATNYPEVCWIKTSCSNGLQVSLIVNLMILSYRRSKKIRTIDSSTSASNYSGLINVAICWVIGLLVTIICLVIIFSQPITSDDLSHGCEFLNNDSINLINFLLFVTFLSSVLFISIININIMRFIRKPVVFPLSQVSPTSLQHPTSISNMAASTSAIPTRHLMDIPDKSSIFTQPDPPICSIQKFSCSSISSSNHVDSRNGSLADISRFHRSNSIFSSAKEDDNLSDNESIFSIRSKSNLSRNSFVSNQIRLHNEILSKLNNTIKVESTKIKLCNDICKLTNCEFKQNFISSMHSPVTLSVEELFNKNNKNVRSVSERSVSSPYPFSLSENSACHYSEDVSYIHHNNSELEKSTFHSNSDHSDSDVIKPDSDSDTCIHSDSDSDDVSLGDIVDHDFNCCDGDCDIDQHDDGTEEEMTEYNKEYILSRPRLQPVPMKKRRKRKSKNRQNYNANITSLQPTPSNPDIKIQFVNPAMNLSRRKAIVNFNYAELPPADHSPISPRIRKIIFPPRSNWNQNMNMPVMLTRRHRMKRIVLHNLLLELAVFVTLMILPYLKNIILYDYTQLSVIIKSFLYLTEILRLLLFAINPFLYIIKNKNIMNDLL